MTVTGLLGPAGSFGFLWNLYCLRKLSTLGLVPLDIVTLNRSVSQHFCEKKSYKFFDKKSSKDLRKSNHITEARQDNTTAIFIRESASKWDFFGPIKCNVINCRYYC